MLGKRATAEMAIALAAVASLSSAQVAAVVADMTYDAAAPVFARSETTCCPSSCSKSPSDRREAWPGWVHERERDRGLVSPAVAGTNRQFPPNRSRITSARY